MKTEYITPASISTKSREQLEAIPIKRSCPYMLQPVK
jgi:hypothetical protein